MWLVLGCVLSGLVLFWLIMRLAEAGYSWLGFLIVVAGMLLPLLWAIPALLRQRWQAAGAQNTVARWVYFLALHCPRCGGKAMPWWHKLMLHGDAQAPCQQCGQKLMADAVPRAMLWGIALLGLILAALAGSLLARPHALALTGGFLLASVLAALGLWMLRPLLALRTGMQNEDDFSRH